MAKAEKYDKILDALQALLIKKDIQHISVNEIAQTAGIGKGSIYYYFPSKEAILDALIERSYEKTLETAASLSAQKNIPPFTRMAMLFQTCLNSSPTFFAQSLPNESGTDSTASGLAFLHHKFLTHLISSLKPPLTEITQQGIDSDEIQFHNADALAEIVLIVLSVKLDNTIVPSSKTQVEETIQALVLLLEKITVNPNGSLNFLMSLD